MEKLAIFYDGACHLCTHEINHYKKMDIKNELMFIDIALNDFEAKDYGLDSKKVQKHFHTRDKNLKMHTGVSAFYLIWKELDIFKPLQKLYEMKLTKKAMDMGYIVFAELRPYLPKKTHCENGTCYR